MKKRADNRFLVFLVFLIILFVVAVGVNRFTGFSIYDPGVSGEGIIKNAVWSFSNSSEYNYSSSIGFSVGEVELIKPEGFSHTEFDGENYTNIDSSSGDIRLGSDNGTYYFSGEYISDVFDSGYDNSLWGDISWNETLSNQSVVISYRVGDSFGDWVGVENGDEINFTGRYFQYKVSLTSDGNNTAVVDDIQVETKYFLNGFIETEFLEVSNLTAWISLEVSTLNNISYDYDIGSGWVDVPEDLSIVSVSTGMIKFRADLVSDGGSTPVLSYLNLTYNVSVANDSLGNAPVLDSIGDQDMVEDVVFYYDVDATDADNDTLTFYDNTSLFNIDSSTGEINFTPGGDGVYSIKISVSDGVFEDYEDIIFTVEENETTQSEESSSTENTQSESQRQVSREESVESEPSVEEVVEIIDENITVNDTLIHHSSNLTGFQKLFTGFGVAIGDVNPTFFVGVIVIVFVIILIVINYFYLKRKGSSYGEFFSSAFRKENPKITKFDKKAKIPNIKKVEKLNKIDKISKANKTEKLNKINQVENTSEVKGFNEVDNFERTKFK